MVMIVGLQFIVPSSQDMDVKIHWTKLYFFQLRNITFHILKNKNKKCWNWKKNIDKLLKSKKY